MKQTGMRGSAFLRCLLPFGTDNLSFRLKRMPIIEVLLSVPKIRAHADPGVRRVVVVRIAVVVHISEVRRRDNVTQPPVSAFKDYPFFNSDFRFLRCWCSYRSQFFRFAE